MDLTRGFFYGTILFAFLAHYIVATTFKDERRALRVAVTIAAVGAVGVLAQMWWRGEPWWD